MQDEYFEQRREIRASLAQKRWKQYRAPVPHSRPRNINDLVPWDDPEFIAECLFWINRMNQLVQDAVNRLSGE